MPKSANPAILKPSSKVATTDSPPRAMAGLFIANATVFTSSFCFMVIELVAGRLIAPYVGSSLHTWTSIIGIALAGIALGNYLGGRIADRYAVTRRQARRTLAVIFFVAALTTAGIGIYNRIAGEIDLKDFFRLRIALHVTLVFFLPCTILGLIGPVVAKMALDLGRLAGRTMGNVYAWGVVGSIFGTFMTGFYFVAVMTTTAIVLSVAGTLAAVGALYGLASLSKSG
ncbi:MAG TPA: fused MFS/spermidine synthase [Phycisphaerae bacterium]|nr:fused MFS/spermidine synthase [Phycisphaerae bacterium]